MTAVKPDLAALDAADPLGPLREAFYLPEGLRYFDGNSLGPQPRAAREAVLRVLEVGWGEKLIAGWNDEGWFDLADRTAARLAPLLGARADAVAVADSTSLNIFKLLAGALAAQPGRQKIYALRDTFPTDLYMAQGLSAWLGAARATLCTFASLEALEVALDESVAVVLLSHVDFRTGERLPMPAFTARAHEVGALVLWDLAHSAGAMPLALEASDVDFAVGCGYKFLNGGPGAPAFAYVAERFHEGLSQPLAGWFGHARPFAFEADYAPAAGVARLKCGTPPVLSLAALHGALSLYEGVELAALRAKSLALGDLFMAEVARRPALGDLVCVTPKDPERRGSQVAFAHPEAYALIQALQAEGIVGDFREPNILRFGLSPAMLRYADVGAAVAALDDLLRSGRHRNPAFQQKKDVT